jgi:hypothetical protein
MPRLRLLQRLTLAAGVPFFLVACTVTYYGQLHRKPAGDTYGTVYTAVAMVEKRTIWLDDYLPYLQERSGEQPYFLREGPNGHTVTATPTASSVIALPAVALFSAFGVRADDFDAWMEAGMATASITAALSVALLFLALLRLTGRGQATLIAATYAWGTSTWGVSGQALWQHSGATLALSALLLALVSRRLTFAGATAGAMVAFRLPTAIMGLLLLPLIGQKAGAWGRFALGLLPYALALGAYNLVAFGSPVEQGYGSGHVRGLARLDAGNLADGVPGLLVSPGRGLFVYSPVLLFALLGLVRAWRTPLYLWTFLAAATYVLFAANSPQWHGGESFGPRRITDALPLLAVLLVPAVDAIWRTRWMWLYAALLAWSVFVQLLGTAAWEQGKWFDRHDITEPGVWWKPLDNELVAMLQAPNVVPRLAAMAALLVGGLVLGALTAAPARPIRSLRTDSGR